MTRLRGQTITESAQQNAATAGAQLVSACDYRHGSTLGHFWGDVQ